MATSKPVRLPIRTEEKFQAFCLDLFKALWNDPHAKLRGRRGQRQDGVDIIGIDRRIGPHARTGVQCKGFEGNNQRIPDIVEATADIESAKKIAPPLVHFVFAYAGDRDVHFQDALDGIHATHLAAGLFEVHPYSWDDLTDALEAFPDLIAKYFPVDWLAVEQSLEFVAVRLSSDERPPADDLAAMSRIAARLPAILNLPAPSQEEREGADKSLHDQIDAARSLVLRGEADAALALLQSVQHSGLPVSAEPSRLQFRLHAQKGNALLILDRRPEAIAELRLASQLAPAEDDKEAFAAYAALQEKDFATAHAHASASLRVNAKHKLALTVWTDTAPADFDAEEIANHVRASGVEPDADLARSVAHRWALNGDAEKAIEWAEWGRGASGFEWLSDATIGEAILQDILEDELTKLGGDIPDKTRASIHSAVEHLERAWHIAKVRPDAGRLVFIGNNLANAYALDGSRDASHATIDEAYALNPQDAILLQRKAAADTARGNASEAWGILRAHNQFQEPQAAYFGAEVAFAANDYAEALRLAHVSFEHLSVREKQHAAWLIVETLSASAKAGKSFEKFAELRNQVPFDPDFFAAGSKAARLAGAFAEAEEIDNAIYSADPAALTPIQRFARAMFFSNREDWAIAADAFVGLYRPDRASPALYQALVALLNADRRREAFKLLSAMPENIRTTARYLRVSAALHERMGNLEGAAADLEKMLRIAPDDIHARMDWLRARFRLGGTQQEGAIQWLRKAKLPVSGKPLELMQFSHWLDAAGRTKAAVALAYSVLRQHWGTSEALHSGYVQLFLQRQQRLAHLRRPKKVRADSWVLLKGPSGSPLQEVIIEGALEPDSSKGEISPQHDLAKLLVGKRVGESIEIGPAHAREVRIVSQIEHKAVRLSQKVLDSHSSLFPASEAIGRVPIDLDSANPFERLQEQARSRAEMSMRAMEAYAGGGLPICLFANVVGVDPYSAWIGLVNERVATVRLAPGDGATRQHAIDAVRSSENAVIDPLTFLQWRDYGILSVLRDTFGQVFVSQSALDLLGVNRELTKRALQGQRGSLEWRGGRMVFRQQTNEDRERLAQYWDDAFADAHRIGTSKSAESLTALGVEAETAELLPPAFADSLAIALETRAVLLCDDSDVRAFARAIGVTATAWCQPLMTVAESRGTADALDGARLAATLIKYRARFVAVHSNYLTAALADYDATEGLLSALRQAQPLSAAQVIVEHLWSAWTSEAISKLARNMLMVRYVHYFRLHHPLQAEGILDMFDEFFSARAERWSIATESASRDARETLRFIRQRPAI